MIVLTFTNSIFLVFFSEMSDYIPEGKLDPTTFQSVMNAADVKYCLAKVSRTLVGT